LLDPMATEPVRRAASPAAAVEDQRECAPEADTATADSLLL